ncbi:hypothetical protein Ljor_0485 [Legionella jordanis]|uniref:Uncharacterized protein n=1 Tax=Legionella jordanis TaxID=456 RepID=A0A0W0V7T7_9GAMM|nr:hypothetical protein Ljor_0485 [Legionella jordanis]VEH12363.1 Uncharacterised protein [Legionella jordanis]
MAFWNQSDTGNKGLEDCLYKFYTLCAWFVKKNLGYWRILLLKRGKGLITRMN